MENRYHFFMWEKYFRFSSPIDRHAVVNTPRMTQQAACFHMQSAGVEVNCSFGGLTLPVLALAFAPS